MEKQVDFSADSVKTQFRHEIAILKALAPHPNYVSYIQHELTETHGSLVMTCAPGVSVSRWVENSTMLTTDHSARQADWAPFAQTLLNAVNYLHCQRLHHLDLKPDNVMVDPPRKSLKLIDFGLACGRSCGQYEGGCKDDKPCCNAHRQTCKGHTASWATHDDSCGQGPSLIAYYSPFMTESGKLSPAKLRYIDLYSTGAILYFWWFATPPYYKQGDSPKDRHSIFMRPYIHIGGMYPPLLDPPLLDNDELIASDDERRAFAAMRYLLCRRQGRVQGQDADGTVVYLTAQQRRDNQTFQCGNPPGESLQLGLVLTGLAQPDDLWIEKPACVPENNSATGTSATTAHHA